MARRSVTGQLNMFDLFENLEPGEVQMVSLMPEDVSEVDEPKIESSKKEKRVTTGSSYQPVGEKVAMSRTYEVDGERIEIAYINYNKVRITKGENPPQIKEFETSKEAVNFYVEKMQELEPDE